jgi:hypothetical protein
MNLTVRKNSKIIVSNIGSVIEQEFLTAELKVTVDNRNYYRHYRINDFDEIKFPKVNNKKLSILNGDYDLIISPRAVAKIALFLFDNNIDFSPLALNINPYLYKGLQSNLYDDEGTFRIKSKYKGLTGGDIFQNDNSSGYFYDFNTRKFILKRPDLEIKEGDFNLKEFKNDYLLVNDFDSIKISYGKIVINADLSLFGKEKSQGYMIKTIKFPLGELDKIKNFTNIREIIGLNVSSVKAPYIYLGKSYE